MSICIVDSCDKVSRARKMCRNHYNQWWLKENPGKKASYCKRYYKQNKSVILEKQKEYRKNHPEYLDPIRKWHKDHPERVKEIKNSWRKNNLAYHAAKEAKRRASKLNATPDWLTKKQLAEIKKIYESCPAAHHVDHIVPLKGKTVCGLHVPWNLQYLPAVDNLRKSNRLMESN